MFAAFDEHAEAILDEQITICEIPAPTHHEEARADYVHRQLAAIGLAVRQDEVGNVIQIAGKLVEEARFEGIFVLRTNAGMTPLNAVLRYRGLLLVEDLFRRAKVQLRTRPIYHSCDAAAIRGHVFCSFLGWCCRRSNSAIVCI